MSAIIDRRELVFSDFDEIIAEAERLAAGDVRVTGNHSFGQILNHLAISQDTSSGRAVPPPPSLMMKLLRPLIRLMVINSRPLKPGVKLPANGESFFWPDKNIDVLSALAALKESIAYYKQNGPLDVHPFFGKLTREQADSLNCRHAALHLSFVHPV